MDYCINSDYFVCVLEIVKNNFIFMLQRGQPRSRFSQNPSSRRGAQRQVPTVQLRNRFHRQSTAASTRARNLQFPLDMDLDMVSFSTPFCYIFSSSSSCAWGDWFFFIGKHAHSQDWTWHGQLMGIAQLNPEGRAWCN